MKIERERKQDVNVDSICQALDSVLKTFWDLAWIRQRSEASMPNSR
jgi:hypothetical protein